MVPGAETLKLRDFDFFMGAIGMTSLECFLVPRKCMRRIPNRDCKGRGCAGLCNFGIGGLVLLTTLLSARLLRFAAFKIHVPWHLCHTYYP